MRIEQVYVACCRADLRLTRCCVASIRRWYPDVPVSLVVDESQGPVPETRFERAWGVTRLATGRRRHGWGFGKLEPLFLPGRQRCLILDSDTVFLGCVLDALAPFPEDFIVSDYSFRPETMARDFFDPARLAVLDPDFCLPDFVFNTGQFVATTGVLRREDFAPHVAFTEPPRLRQPEVFGCADQGVLNYVLVRRWRQGSLTLRRHRFMKWAGSLEPGSVRPEQLTDDSPFARVLHWAGPKPRSGLLSHMPHAELLHHFEALARAAGAGSGLAP